MRTTTRINTAMDTPGSWMNPIEFREANSKASPFKLIKRAGGPVTDCAVEDQAVFVILIVFETEERPRSRWLSAPLLVFFRPNCSSIF